MDDGVESEERYTKGVLLDQIEASYTQLETLVRGLSSEQLTHPGPDGWAVKDHLAHLATWEEGIAELLQRRPRWEAMGVSEAVRTGQDQETVNDLIYRRNAGLTAEAATERFRSAHRRLLEVLAGMSEDELYQPYTAYSEADGDRQDPVVYWVAGNTFDHFDEHRGYIERLVGGE